MSQKNENQDVRAPGTRDTVLDHIGHLPHLSIGTRRVWWHDPSHDWQVRVSVDLGNGSVTVQSGPCWDHGGSPDGTWGEECAAGVVVHMVSGYDVPGLVQFAEWVQDTFVGDEGIVPAVNHLIACQRAQAERELLDECAASAADDAAEIKRQHDRPKHVVADW